MMKKLLFLFTVLPVLALLHTEAVAQDNLKIKDTNGNTLFEAREAGILVRKMTTVDRIAVAGLDSDDNGLLVYDTDTKSLWIWHDAAWVEIDGIDLVNDADSDPTNELQTWMTLPGIPAGFNDNTDDVNDADSDPTNELQTWITLPGIPAGFSDNVDDVNDADHNPTNELQNWSNLPGIPADFLDGIDNVNDADSNPLNEKNNSLQRNGTNLEITDAGGTLVANIGWSVDAGKVFNTTDNIGIGTNTTPAKLTVQNGPVLFTGTTGAVPVSGAGTRLMWVPFKHAFRAGVVTSTQWDNVNIGQRSFVAGGTDNVASGWNSIVAGGGEGSATADGAFVGGGFDNAASGVNAAINGGEYNTATGINSFIAGGRENNVTGNGSFIGGGVDNSTSALNSVVVGGVLNSALADGDFVGGGYDNTATGGNSFVGGGVLNMTSGGNSFAAAGLSNTAAGYASFVTGRENIASGNHSFTAGHGLLAKSMDEIVVGSYNKDYSPVTPLGYNNADRLFVIGNGYDSGSRSNAMTILKGGQVGIGTDAPKAGLHVQGNKDSSDHIMLIENLNPNGNGLKIKINGNHPLWVELTDTSGFFVPTLGVPAALSNLFEPTAAAIKNYLLQGTPLTMSALNFSNLFAPGSILDDMGVETFVAGGVCKGAELLVDFVNGIGLESITLPDLPLEAIPTNIPDLPSIPTVPYVQPFELLTPGFIIPMPDCCFDDITINPPDIEINSPTFINSPLTTFNNGIGVVNTGIGNLNGTLETGYDNLRSGLASIDNLEIQLPQLQVPAQIGPLTCPNPNPFDDLSFSFNTWNEEYGFVDPISKDNEFITFVDKGNRKLGAVTGKSFGSFAQDYFKKEKVMEIFGHISGMVADDGGIVKNAFGLAKDVFDFVNASNKIGVSYESGFGDYAEWLERADHTETIGYGDIVGIRGGKISLSLENAEQIMVVSKAPIVRGNAPAPETEQHGNDIAFIGQVPVKIMGPVLTGDYIVANPSTPGYGLAVSPDDITAAQLAMAVGKSWESNTAPGFKFVNTIVGMHNNAWVNHVRELQARMDAQDSAIASLSARLEQVEQTSATTAAVNRKQRL